MRSRPRPVSTCTLGRALRPKGAERRTRVVCVCVVVVVVWWCVCVCVCVWLRVGLGGGLEVRCLILRAWLPLQSSNHARATWPRANDGALIIGS